MTGATGFVGGHLLDAAAAAGHSVQALTRRAQLPRDGTTWIEGGLDHPAALARMCEGADAVIHVAGAINAADRAGFARSNIDGTRAVLAAAARVARFVQVSSLAAREPALSDYGWSKAAGDAAVRSARLAAAIVRPPAVYGPGDRETLALFRLAGGVVPVIGGGRFSIVHAVDLAAALLAAIDAPPATYEVADATPGGFSQAEFARAVAAATGRRSRIVALPRGLLPIAAAFDTTLARLSGRAPRLSHDRARYFAHYDWVADAAPLIATGLWAPRIAATQGLAETAAWYRRAGWLR